MEVKNLLFVSFEYFCSICDLNHLGGVGAAEEKGDFCHKNRVVGRSEITKSPIHRSFCVISVTPKEGWAQ